MIPSFFIFSLISICGWMIFQVTLIAGRVILDSADASFKKNDFYRRSRRHNAWYASPWLVSPLILVESHAEYDGAA